MTTRQSTGRGALAAGLALLACAVAHSQQPATFTPEQLRQDVTAIEAAIERTHPDIAHSVDPAVLGRAIEDVRAKLDHPMSAGEAWTVLSRLNSVMADGHLAVTYPGGAANEIRQYVKGGGRLFPYAVHVTPEAEIFVRARLDETATPLVGRRIEMLDGVTAHDVAEKLLAHMNGDTVAMRAQLLSERFAFWYWKFYGERKTVRLRIAGADSIVEASSATPRAFQEKSFEQLFRLDLLDDAGALLTIDEFYWRDKPQFYAFTREAFARMRNAGTRTLIIDIRANPGGDDDVWIEGIMPYIATRSFSNGSSYRLKIIEGRQKEGQKVGDVVRSSQETQYPPQLDNPLRFKGKVYVPDQSAHVFIRRAVQHRHAGLRIWHAGGNRRRGAQHAERGHPEHQAAEHSDDDGRAALCPGPQLRGRGPAAARRDGRGRSVPADGGGGNSHAPRTRTVSCGQPIVHNGRVRCERSRRLVSVLRPPLRRPPFAIVDLYVFAILVLESRWRAVMAASRTGDIGQMRLPG